MHSWFNKRTKASLSNIEVDSVITEIFFVLSRKKCLFKFIYSQITFRLNCFIFLNITFEVYWRDFHICWKFGNDFKKVFNVSCNMVYISYVFAVYYHFFCEKVLWFQFFCSMDSLIIFQVFLILPLYLRISSQKGIFLKRFLTDSNFCTQVCFVYLYL